MKLKQATQLAIIGVMLQVVQHVIYFLVNLGLLPFLNPQTQEQLVYYKYLGLIGIIGIFLLLPFFITLFRSQK